ncbi:GNAT family N-acetyltransferase [Phyllobacterium sp. YR531]|uniref:GNAT family N-acetyltransferase n=1 Tax=Phyllobacterium sp. YR531 TaxID=1144343 RepID=UPI00026F5AEE|nr:GNAT family N-acetyltransferase [Phyllobacterium sp. YR531]EJN05638.1 acetyltransferase [Phyllobacterium sp. YR531]
MAVVLKQLTTELVDDADVIDGSFQVDSCLVLSAVNGNVDFSIAPTEPRIKTYERDDQDDLASYIETDSKLAMIAYEKEKPAGLLLVSENWNGYALIDNIKVDIHHRKAGIGRMLIDAAAGWAKTRGLPGIMLETQDNNVNACLFYQRYGFILRGFDTGIYSAIPATRHETALFWYLTF